MATSFTVNRTDLEFILQQILIAEAHASGTSLAQAISDATGISLADTVIAPFGLRTVDGRDNNLIAGQEDFGAADTLFPRLLDPVFLNDNDGDSIDFGAGPVVQGNYATPPGGDVVDADPRTISNLVVNQTITNSAAVDAWFANPLSLAKFAEDHPLDPMNLSLGSYIPVRPGELEDATHLQITNTDIANIPNQSPDIGLSPSFNAWMTFFGQFFDHGLDLVTKGDAGTVYIPLEADDPLIAGADGILGNADDLPPHLRFMALTRGTVTIDANGIPQHENTTTPFIDQNQTYTSHSSHHVFLREYQRVDLGQPPVGNLVTVATGRLLDGTTTHDGALANWAELKAQSLTMLGINLNDFDVHNAPLMAADQYGNLILGPNGFAQIVMAPDAMHPDPWLLEGNPDGSVTTEGALKSGHQFLIDIAHHAAPGFVDDNNDDRDNDGIVDGTEGAPIAATPRIAMVADDDLLDFNGDGVADAADVTAAVLAGVLIDANGDLTIDELDLADVNLDGVIDAADLVADDNNPLTYDDEMLNAHFITGDGRGNENIALTTVHSVFHAEHNRLAEANKLTILESGDVAFLNQWLLVPVVAVPVDQAGIDALIWDGDRLFQSARFVTEMQYQHLVFEEFARTIAPGVDFFPGTTDAQIDPSIIAEFAHAVYRFGHSMLNDTVNRVDNNLESVDGGPQVSLIEAFLNPQLFAASGASIGEVIGNIARGASLDIGNEIDEFVVPQLQSNLLGLPLDLAALNIARGRDTGIPTLNDARTQLYNDFGLPDLIPYTGWFDFAQHMKNPSSIINFMAAYGTHHYITDQVDDGSGLGTTRDKTFEEMRAAASTLLFGVGGVADIPGNPGVTAGVTGFTAQDRLDFVTGADAYATNLGGLNLVDLWIGGLAEELNQFGGMLGSTFNFIFEYQMEHLQTGDRLYYLSRTDGLNLLSQLEPNTFADLVMRNSSLGDDYATHLNSLLFTTPDLILELDRGIAQADYNPDNPADQAAGGFDPVWDNAFQQLFDPKVVRVETSVVAGHTVGGTLKFSGGEHVVLGGTEGDDALISDKGIDTLWGDGGNDYLNAGSESDSVFGGSGDDIIEDPFGDDVLRGEAGNDVISAGSGLDIIFGGADSDYLILGQDDKEAFGDEGEDFILGGSGSDAINGGEGNDWIEGGAGNEVIGGDNNAGLLFPTQVGGDDILWGQGGDNDYHMELGDDIAISSVGTDLFEGFLGFDWAIGKYDPTGVDFDFLLPVFVVAPDVLLRDRFSFVEAGSGWIHNDIIGGDDRGHVAGVTVPDVVPTLDFVDHVLTETGIDKIDGLRAFLGGTTAGQPITGLETLFGPGATSFRDGNILMGGDGSDLLAGRGGFDILDGDAWLNVRIRIDMGGGVFYTAESLNTETLIAGDKAGMVYDENGVLQFGGSSLNSLMLDRTINPSQLSIVREILNDADPSLDVDTALFQGNRAEYEIEGITDTRDANGIIISSTGAAADVDLDGFIKVRDLDDGITPAPGVALSRGLLVDDTDLLRNIERLQFADQLVTVGEVNNTPAAGLVTIIDDTQFNLGGVGTVVTPLVGQVLSAVLSNLVEPDGTAALDPVTGLPAGGTFAWQSQRGDIPGVWTTITTGPTYTAGIEDIGLMLRAVAQFEDNSGVPEQIASTGTDNVTEIFTVDENSPTDVLVIQADGTSDIPFDPDLDPASLGGQGVVVVDPTTLFHVLVDDAGGRFKLVGGVNAQQLAVNVGGPVFLNFEDAANPDHRFEIVVQTYLDNTLTQLVTTRQLTVEVTDVVEPLDPIITSPATASVAENQTAAIDVNAIDDVNSEGNGLTYSFTNNAAGGADNGLFDIVPETGVVTFKLAPDFEMGAGSGATLNDYLVQVTVTDADGRTDTQDITVAVTDVNENGIAPELDLSGAGFVELVADDFVGNQNLEGYVYRDAVFGGTGADARGIWSATGNTNEGALHIDLGGNSSTTRVNMNGAFEKVFNLAQAATVTISFDYRLQMSSDTDAGENGQVRVRIDNTDLGTGGIVAQVLGVDGPGANPDTGWATFTQQVNLAAGNHTLALGGLMTGKTTGSEFVDVDFDNVSLSFGGAGVPGNDFETTFIENGGPVAIASGPMVTDDDPVLASAMIVLTNARPGDVLNVGALTGGITSSLNLSVPGQITLSLSNVASHADYEAAIQGVTFSNTSDNPNPVGGASPRIVTVTVNDGVFDSNVATTTIVVNAVNDAPIANNDTIVTNIVDGSPIVVPEWALLANDVDPDSALDITVANGAVGVEGLSLATNPGSVTLMDAGANGGSFNYTANDGQFNSSASVTVRSQVGAGESTVDDFVGNQNLEGYVYRDAVFGGTGADARGIWSATGNTNAGALHIDLGGNSSTARVNMNGAFEKVFNLAQAATVTISFDYRLQMSSDTDAGENGQVRVRIDNTDLGTGGIVAQVLGVDGPGANPDTGWATFTQQVNLAAGNHTLALGGLMTGKTTGSEFVDVDFDNVSLSFGGGGAVPPPGQPIIGGIGNQILVGDATGSSFNGGAGNDIILAGLGNDTITWNVGDGRDIVDGGANVDTFIVNGDGTTETFRIYTLAEALAAGMTGLAPNTEIVITRNGTDNASIIAELDNIEEISVNTLNVSANDGNGVPNGGGANGDTVEIIGDFNATSLDFSTITIEGGAGDDTVDISGLTSEHRIVFNGNGGTDEIIGDLRPQDEVDFVASAEVTVVDDGSGGNVFVFGSIAEAMDSVVSGFQPGDKIDLSGIDANSGADGHQAFTLQSGTGINTAGNVVVSYEKQGDGVHTILSAHVDDDAIADFTIDLVGYQTSVGIS